MLKSAVLADVQVGDEVEIEEHYADAFFHFRGKVGEKHTDNTLVFGSLGHFRFVEGVNEDRRALKIWIRQPDPPTTVGSVVKYYDSHYLQYRTARVDHDGDWYDIAGGSPVELDGLMWSILFDAGKDA